MTLTSFVMNFNAAFASDPVSRAINEPVNSLCECASSSLWDSEVERLMDLVVSSGKF